APPPYRIPSWAAQPDGRLTERTVATSAWGWPALALSGVERQLQGFNEVNAATRTRRTLQGYWALAGDPATRRIRRLPLRPIWAGLLLDTTDAPPVWGTFARGGSPGPDVEGGCDHGF